MSHLWPELLRIVLCPDQVVLERGKLAISLKGFEPRYFAPEIIPVEPGHEPTLWAAPLTVLGIALDGLPEGSYDAIVILSNHFVHYPFIRSGVTNTDFSGPVENALKIALSDILAQHRCRLISLLPRIVALASNVIEDVPEEPIWLVAVEEGLACFGLIKDGEISYLQNLCMWPASSVELLALLDKEADALSLKEQPRNIMLWSQHESDEVFLPTNRGWKIIRIGNQLPSPVPSQLFFKQKPFNDVRA